MKSSLCKTTLTIALTLAAAPTTEKAFADPILSGGFEIALDDSDDTGGAAQVFQCNGSARIKNIEGKVSMQTQRIVLLSNTYDFNLTPTEIALYHSGNGHGLCVQKAFELAVSRSSESVRAEIEYAKNRAIAQCELSRGDAVTKFSELVQGQSRDYREIEFLRNSESSYELDRGGEFCPPPTGPRLQPTGPHACAGGRPRALSSQQLEQTGPGYKGIYAQCLTNRGTVRSPKWASLNDPCTAKVIGAPNAGSNRFNIDASYNASTKVLTCSVQADFFVPFLIEAKAEGSQCYQAIPVCGSGS